MSNDDRILPNDEAPSALQADPEFVLPLDDLPADAERIPEEELAKD